VRLGQEDRPAVPERGAHLPLGAVDAPFDGGGTDRREHGDLGVRAASPDVQQEGDAVRLRERDERRAQLALPLAIEEAGKGHRRGAGGRAGGCIPGSGVEPAIAVRPRPRVTGACRNGACPGREGGGFGQGRQPPPRLRESLLDEVFRLVCVGRTQKGDGEE
jgi:hypothetical protein